MKSLKMIKCYKTLLYILRPLNWLYDLYEKYSFFLLRFLYLTHLVIKYICFVIRRKKL